MCGCGLDSTGSGLSPVMGSFKYVNKPSSSIKRWEFFKQWMTISFSRWPLLLSMEIDSYTCQSLILSLLQLKYNCLWYIYNVCIQILFQEYCKSRTLQLNISSFLKRSVALIIQMKMLRKCTLANFPEENGKAKINSQWEE